MVGLVNPIFRPTGFSPRPTRRAWTAWAIAYAPSSSRDGSSALSGGINRCEANASRIRSAARVALVEPGDTTAHKYPAVSWLRDDQFGLRARHGSQPARRGSDQAVSGSLSGEWLQ